MNNPLGDLMNRAGGRAGGANPLAGPTGRFMLAFLKLTTKPCDCDVCTLLRQGLQELDGQLTQQLIPTPATETPAGE